MCDLCLLDPVNAVNGVHDAMAKYLNGPANAGPFGKSPAFDEVGSASPTEQGNGNKLKDVNVELPNLPDGALLPPGISLVTGPAATVSNGSGTASTTETASAPSPIGDLADYLRLGYWGGIGFQHNVTSSGSDPNNGVLHYNISGFTSLPNHSQSDADGISAARATLVREAFKLIEATLGIQFVETTSTDAGFVDFFFTDNDSGAYATSSLLSGRNVNYSLINVASSWSGGTSTYDDYTLQTIFHEIGHALGLGHQGPYNGAATYGVHNVFDNDSWQASMMSYFSQTENTSVTASYEFLQTPMSVDWMALDDIYGAQGFGIANAFTGDTVWGFNTNITSAVSDIWNSFSDYAWRTASTIVDSGGIDTLDFSGYTATQLINLSPTLRTSTAPSISNIGGSIGNLTLAEGTIIENAIGGSGADTFFGNDADNVLTGNAGNDTFNDSAGNDTYYGGAGTADEVNFAELFSSYSFNVVGSFVQVIKVTIDLVENTVEWFNFSDQTLSYADVVNSITPNTPPTANPDAYNVGEDVVLNGASVLGNDTDPDTGASLSVSAVEGAGANVGSQIMLASGALLTVNNDGTFTYDQNGVFDSLLAGQTAVDSFDYTVSDGIATDTTSVSITIAGAQEPPNAVNDGYNVAENATVANNVLDNDSDPDLDPLTVFAVNGDAANVGNLITLASGALLTLNTNGTFDYDPNGMFDGLETGQTDTDSFTYTISDGQGGTDTASVNITIDGVSPPTSETPIVIDFEGIATGAYSGEAGLDVSGLTVTQGTNLSGSQRGQTATNGDFSIAAAGEDFDLNSIELRAVSGRVRVNVEAWDDGALVGTATFNPRSNKVTNGSFDASFDSIDYVVFNGDGQYYVDDIGLVIRQLVTGNQSPIAVDDAYTTGEATTFGGNLLTNDNDPEGDPIALASVAGQSGGIANLSSGAVITFNSDGTFTYDPNNAFNNLYDGQTDTDTFVYVIEDNQGGSDTGSVTVTINGSGTPPSSVTVDFEAAVPGQPISEDGFNFANTDVSIRATGVASGIQAGVTDGGPIIVTRTGDQFDFESAVFSAVSGKNVTASVSGYMNGTLIDTQTFRIRDNKETTKSLDNAIFDNVDEVHIDAPGGVIVDDMEFLV